MGRGAAHVESRNRGAVVGVSQHWPRRIELVERETAVKDVAADKPELALEVERRENLAGDDGRPKARRVTLHRVDHQVGDGLARLAPRPTIRQLRRDVLAKERGDMA